ncbi:sugar ABC transporter permease [Streptomyces sp. BE20]|uniref:carbohydrate ABC transporter permease n=1 Tax=Streptomyces sp. BE20 TaxID=3002525 RepID=UPI002E7760EB|nr:sugar ABC transporter permease [Streptomyces sp. BE20]MEE1820852.1 sugar ABC transporter permease [Streptomyces sp. BE20]
MKRSPRFRARTRAAEGITSERTSRFENVGRQWTWPSTGSFVVFVLPTLAIFTTMVLAPILWTLYIGLTDERASRKETSFVGLANYGSLLNDEGFRHSLWNTVVITAIVVVLTNLLGLAVALMLRKQSRLYSLLRGIYFTPVILSAVVVSVIGRSLLADKGLLNSTLVSLGVQNPPGWLTDPSYAIYSVAGIMVWQMLGFAVVVYLAGLSGIPVELEEAASLDGAGPWQQFRAITWPMLAPALTINTVLLIITSFKVYDQIAVLTNGGPGTNGTATVAFDVVRTAFSEQRPGVASAMAGTMLLVTAAASVTTLKLLQRREVNS